MDQHKMKDIIHKLAHDQDYSQFLGKQDVEVDFGEYVVSFPLFLN